jgi:cell division protein FtsW
MITRASRSPFANWWWTVDKMMLVLIIALIVVGVILSFAASPAVARDLRIADEFHFVRKQLIYLVPAFFIMVGISFLQEKQLRRLALVVFLGGIGLMIATLFFGMEVKGARRWISLAGVSLQPSEITKPAFVLLSAWLFSESMKTHAVHTNVFAFILYGLFVVLLVAQPDIGQTVLVTIVWGGLFFLAGLSWLWIALLAVIAVIGLFAAYSLVPHVTDRIDRFLDPSSGDTFQVDVAIQSFLRGGWFGQGPGEGLIKRHLPDSHTDFIFAVAAEEFGIIFCLLIVALFTVIAIRALGQAFKEDDIFRRLAISGLVFLFCFQACINMGVNLQLLPAKGMTLPFISYGGSSLLSGALTMGMLLALTRRRASGMRYSKIEWTDARQGPVRASIA